MSDSHEDGYRVFISHGGEDTYIAQQLLKPRVEESGATVFLDSGAIDFGDDFRSMLLKELADTHELLVLFTPSSVQRAWVLAEVGATLIRGKRIVAVRYGVSETELQRLGVLSLLGTISLLELDDFDDYVRQLSSRVLGGTDE